MIEVAIIAAVLIFAAVASLRSDKLAAEISDLRDGLARLKEEHEVALTRLERCILLMQEPNLLEPDIAATIANWRQRPVPRINAADPHPRVAPQHQSAPSPAHHAPH